MRIDDLTDDAAKIVTRLSTILPKRLIAIRDAHLGQPVAVKYDGDRTSGHTSKKFCERCEQDPEHCDCGADQRIVSYPTVSDPTGEAAIRSDRARTDRVELERHLRALHRAATAAEKILERYQPRQPTDKDRTTTNRTAERGCDSCSRTKGHAGQPRWDAIWRSSTLDDKLWDLCRWCYDWTRDTGRIPTPAEVDRHHQGLKVARPPAA